MLPANLLDQQQLCVPGGDLCYAAAFELRQYHHYHHHGPNQEEEEAAK